MLLIACSAITTASAQKKIYPNTPQKVVSALENVINLHGQNEGQTYSVTKNPNTNIIESKERIDPIAATAVGKGPYLSYISNAFKADEQFSSSQATTSRSRCRSSQETNRRASTSPSARSPHRKCGTWPARILRILNCAMSTPSSGMSTTTVSSLLKRAAIR